MKLLIGTVATVSGVLFALSMASANPSLTECVDYSIFRSPAIFVAEVTGGAILICGPCTVGS